MFDVSKITEEAKPIVQQVARIYYQHTQNFFIGLMVHGSALKGGFIPGLSDIDFHLYLKEAAFDKNGLLPLELSMDIHKDLAKIEIYPFGYIQCEALSTKLPTNYTPPVPGAYHIVAGKLPIKEATNQQLKEAAKNSLDHLEVTPRYLANLLEHGEEQRNRLVRLLSTQVSPIIYHVLTIEKENAIEAWQLPKNEAIKLLPTKEMRSYAEQFYESAKRFYPEKKSIEDALGMVQNGVSFFRSAKHWYQHLNKNAGS